MPLVQPLPLKHSEITARILNEEGQKLGPSSSLNAARTGKQDHSNITCHYCKKKGHIQRDCRKRKNNEVEEEEEEEDSTLDSGSDSGDSKKAVNMHVVVSSAAVL